VSAAERWINEMRASVLLLLLLVRSSESVSRLLGVIVYIPSRSPRCLAVDLRSASPLVFVFVLQQSYQPKYDTPNHMEQKAQVPEVPQDPPSTPLVTSLDPMDPMDPTDPKDPIDPKDPMDPPPSKDPTVPTTPPASEAPKEDEFVGPAECLQKKSVCFGSSDVTFVFCLFCFGALESERDVQDKITSLSFKG